MIVHITGYGWSEGTPHLRRTDGEPLALCGHVAFRVEGHRRCIGWWDPADGVHRPCAEPGDTVPTSGPQCVACSRREGTWECMTCDGFACPPLHPSVARRCQGEHVLYLACFGDLPIKVGTAAAHRRNVRLEEQGAQAAAHVALGPGPVIKQMEALAVRLGLAEAFQRSVKWRLFRQPPAPAARVEAWILEAARLLAGGLPDSYAPHLHAPRFVPLPPPPDMAGLELIRIEPGALVAGDACAGRGHILVLRDQAGPFALDLGTLRGHRLDLDPGEDARPPARQLGLFG